LAFFGVGCALQQGNENRICGSRLINQEAWGRDNEPNNNNEQKYYISVTPAHRQAQDKLAFGQAGVQLIKNTGFWPDQRSACPEFIEGPE
jgi:hypothetical protein